MTDYECQGEDAYVPVDPYGNKIQLQRFDMDALDNITRVRTLFEEGMIDARYHFDNPWDPAQLTGITINGLEDDAFHRPGSVRWLYLRLHQLP